MVYCTRCGKKCIRTLERKSLIPITKKISIEHIHRGLPYYLYNVCEKRHYTHFIPQKIIRVDWDSCTKCDKIERLKNSRKRLRRSRSVRRIKNFCRRIRRSHSVSNKNRKKRSKFDFTKPPSPPPSSPVTF